MSSISQRPALLDLQLVAEYLGQPLNSVRRWIHHPPAGFPKPVMLGRKITVRAAELEAWASGSLAPGHGTSTAGPDAPVVWQPPRRGRPPKQPKEATDAGIGV